MGSPIKHYIVYPITLLPLVPLLLMVLLFPLSSSVSVEKANKTSSAGIFWSTSKDEGDLMRKLEKSSNENDEFEGGFSSLDGMLQWAIGNSDPVKLKEKAQNVQDLPKSELAKRQAELKELVEKLKMPSDAELMQVAIADLNNSSLSLEDRHRALHELLVLVEPIDNANDLNKLQGLAAVIHELHHSEPEIRTTAAWILGKASQNNPVVQYQILELGALPTLMRMVKTGSVEEAVKALYAVSALIVNNAPGQELFYKGAGDLILQDMMSNSSSDIRLRKRSVFLVADLADSQSESTKKFALPFFSNHLFLKSVVDLTLSTDLDLQEKALMAIRSLLKLSISEPLVFKDFCRLDGALERMRKQFEELMSKEDQKDFAVDMEILRRDVEIIFQGKLEKVTWVPT